MTETTKIETGRGIATLINIFIVRPSGRRSWWRC